MLSEPLIGAAQTLEPHRLTTYLHSLAAQFHGYYTRNRIISADRDLTRARLALVAALRVVMANALGLLGVSAPERMEPLSGGIRLYDDRPSGPVSC